MATMWRWLAVYINQLNQKLGTDVRNLIVFLGFIAFVIYVWVKVEAAKRRHDEERRRRAEQRNAAHRQHNPQPAMYPGIAAAAAIPAALGAANPEAVSRSISQNEMRTRSPKSRYLESGGWNNQCVCISTDLIIERNAANNEYSMRTDCVDILKGLASRHRLFIVYLLPSTVTIDESKLNQPLPIEQNIIELFHKNGIIEAGLKIHRILFCTTQKGKSAMVRQLSPTLYIDRDEKVLSDLHQHLTEVVQISTNVAAGTVAPTVFRAQSVADYFR